MSDLAELLSQLIGIVCDVYSVMVLAGVVLSWLQFNPRHPFAMFVRRSTEPVYDRIRRFLPTMIGGIDLSPLVLLLLVQLLRAAALGLLGRGS